MYHYKLMSECEGYGLASPFDKWQFITIETCLKIVHVPTREVYGKQFHAGLAKSQPLTSQVFRLPELLPGCRHGLCNQLECETKA